MAESAGPVKAAPHSTSVAGYRVQLSSHRRSLDEAIVNWRRLQSKHGGILQDVEPCIQYVDLGPQRGSFYRLQVGPFLDERTASATCDRLKARGQDCFLVQATAPLCSALDDTIAAMGENAWPPTVDDRLRVFRPEPVEPASTVRPAVVAKPVEAPAGRSVSKPSEDRKLMAVEFDIDAPPATRYQLTPTLHWGASLTVESILQKNYDLDAASSDDHWTTLPELDIALTYEPRLGLWGFLDLELSRQVILDDRGHTRRPATALEVKEAYVVTHDVMDGLSFQIGRQDFDDEREWLYSQELDGVRAYYALDPFGLEASVSREALIDRDLLNNDVERNINNYFLLGRYATDKRSEIDGYVLVRDDKSSRRRDLVFFGMRSIGRFGSNLKYWADGAVLRGQNRSRHIKAFGFDLGGSYRFRKWPWKPYVTIGYAFGTGDRNRGDDVDRDFRQTGLEDNEGKFWGVANFKYYGQVLDPELSNLAIFTAGVGARPVDDASVDLIFHHYSQHDADNDINGSDLKIDPVGKSRDVGQEIDVALGYRVTRNLNMQLITGAFLPGRAFASDADPAYVTKFWFRYNF